MAQLKIDENLPRAVKDILVTAGHDAMTVADQDLAGAVDDAIGETLICRGNILPVARLVAVASWKCALPYASDPSSALAPAPCESSGAWPGERTR